MGGYKDSEPAGNLRLSGAHVPINSGYIVSLTDPAVMNKQISSNRSSGSLFCFRTKE